jgi:hypothetical protein
MTLDDLKLPAQCPTCTTQPARLLNPGEQRCWHCRTGKTPTDHPTLATHGELDAVMTADSPIEFATPDEIQAARLVHCHDSFDVTVDDVARVTRHEDGSFWVQGWLRVAPESIDLEGEIK